VIPANLAESAEIGEIGDFKKTKQERSSPRSPILRFDIAARATIEPPTLYRNVIGVFTARLGRDPLAMYGGIGVSR
jgi:hypothetical protein